MSKKAKPQVTTTNQTTEMPGYVQDAQKNLLSTGQSTLAPYLANPGYGVAGFNGDQQSAFQGVRDMFAQGNAEGGIPTSEIQRYLNPYTSQVVDTTTNQLRNQNDRTLAGIHAQQAAGSAFGGSGSRAALMESEQNRNFGDTLANTTSQLMSQGYNQATQTATAAQQMRQSNLQALLGIGGQQQQQQQTELDGPLNALTRLAAITPQQYGSTTSGTQSTTAPQQQTGLQQGLGLLLSLGGMKTAGGGSLAGSALAALPAMFSDRDAKTDIEKIGTDPDTGVDMYAYRYKSDPKSYPKVVGPMAQDVEKRFPGSTRRMGGLGGMGGLVIKRAA